MNVARAGKYLGPPFIAIGAILGAPVLVVVGVLALLAMVLSGIWSRYGLRNVRYERRFERDRTVWGEDIDLQIAVRNDKLLPLWWLSVEDETSSNTTIREVSLTQRDNRHAQVLESNWSVPAFGRVVRRVHVAADRRGVYTFGPATVTAADLFGYGVATEERDEQGICIVRPRVLPVLIQRPPFPQGDLRARETLFEDPTLFAGVRPYRFGDPLKRVHWRATIRTGTPVSKRFDPSKTDEVLLALDLQTMSGVIWTSDDDLAESLMVATASLARHLLLDGAACGAAVMAMSRVMKGYAFLAPRTGSDQVGAIADLLARLESVPSAPFDQLLVRIPQRVTVGTSVVVVTGRSPEPYADSLVRLNRIGFPVQVVALGPNAGTAVSEARRLGLAAVAGIMAPDWRTSDALVLAS